MFTIFTEPHDPVGTWLADRLRPCTPVPVHHLITPDLCQVKAVETEQIDDTVQFRIELASGFIIDSRTLAGVVNRVVALPPGLALRRGTPERTAVVRNFSSPVWRLLAGLPGPVLNRPSPQGLSGDFRLASEWAALAEQAGLPPLQGHAELSSAGPKPEEEPGGWRRVVVIGAEVVPIEADASRLPSGIERNCRRIAEAAKVSIIGIDLVRLGRSEWRFVGVDLQPDLTRGGDAAVAAVARALACKAAQTPTGDRDHTAAGSKTCSFDSTRLRNRFMRLRFAHDEPAFSSPWWRFLLP